VHVPAHPDFTARDAAILQPEKAENLHVQFRSGPHTLVAKRIEGSYPNYRCVIPHEFLADATIPETHHSALISWLRSLVGKSNTVRLTWGRPGPLTLTHRDQDSDAAATMQVPVITSGVLPAISFSPQFLADALVIGSTLRLIDSISPGLVTDPSVENYCVLMPCRCVVEDEIHPRAPGSGSCR